MSSQSDARLRVWAIAAILFVLLSTLVIAMSSRGTLISGFVNSAIEVNSESSAATELAELAVELGAAPEISTDQLEAIVRNVLERAQSGDPHAALVALEIAALQRESE